MTATPQLGVTPAPAPERNGQLLKLPTADQIYLVIDGFRHWVPNPQTFANLFLSGATVSTDPGIGAISEGAPLTDGALLVKGDNSPQVYLVTNQLKRWIIDPSVFSLYQFDGGKIKTVPQIVIDFVPQGPNVNGPPQAS